MTAPNPSPTEASESVLETTRLWCMHILGPDDVHAAPDFWTAHAWATELNVAVAARAKAENWSADDNYPLTQACAAEWPWSADEHAVDLAKQIAERAAHDERRTALLSDQAPTQDGADADRGAAALDLLAKIYDANARGAITADDAAYGLITATAVLLFGDALVRSPDPGGAPDASEPPDTPATITRLEQTLGVTGPAAVLAAVEALAKQAADHARAEEGVRRLQREMVAGGAGVLPEGVGQKVVYVAADQSEHSRPDLAAERNVENARVDAANKALMNGATVWEADRIRSGFASYTGHEVLKRITAETPLIISHWQCRDTPGYKVISFERYYVFVAGDAGSWSGSYGDKVTIGDLARYAEDTLRKHPELDRLAPAPSSAPEE